MKKIRCALYPRVSTEEQFLNGLSLDAQHKDLTDFANRMGYEIVGIYPDEGVSARKPVSKRPALLRLLEDVKQDKIDIILVTKLDRWFRNIKEYQTTEEILQAHNCYWKTIYEDYDTSTANGQMVVNIMLAVAQNECDRTSERIKAVFEHKKRKQEHLNGPVPFGYKNVNKHLQKDAETSEIVDEIFRYYFACFSKRATISYILSTYGDNSPTSYQINNILSSEIYAGMRYGRTGYCEPYITVEQHTQILATCQAKTYAASKEPYLFSQLIVCPHCGRKLIAFTRRHKCKDGSVTTAKRYRCDQKQRSHTAPCLTEHIVESYMLEHLAPQLERDIFELKEMEKASKKPQDNTLKIKSEIERLNFLFQKGRISIEYYDKEYSNLEKRLSSAARKNLATLDAYTSIQKELVGNWKKIYNELDYAHKKIFWKRIVKEIYVDPDTHKVCGFSFSVYGCSK